MPRFVACEAPNAPVDVRKCGGDYTANYRGCITWKEVMAALARHARERGKKRTVTGHPVAPKAKWTGPSEKQ